jgi:hypothetical protein
MIYRVLVTRDVTESATFRVFANSPEEAANLALTQARGPNFPIAVAGYIPVWERDDCEPGEPYLGDPEEAVQEGVA